MISPYSGTDDKDGNKLHVGDIIEVPGTMGTIRFKVVLLEEDGFNGFYAEEVTDLGGMTRTQRVLLSAMRDIKLVARVK